jgi:hypothetical protein
VIREINLDKDLDRIVELFGQLWPDETIDSKQTRAILEKSVANLNYKAFGYEKNGVLLGIITAFSRPTSYYEGKTALIEELVVDKERQRTKYQSHRTKFKPP